MVDTAHQGVKSLRSLRGGFEGIDGASQWAGLTGTNTTAPRSEILFNIDGVNGTGEVRSAACGSVGPGVCGSALSLVSSAH